MSKAGGATDNCFTNFRSVHQLAQFRECRRAVVSTTRFGRLWLLAAQLHTATMTGRSGLTLCAFADCRQWVSRSTAWRC